MNLPSISSSGDPDLIPGCTVFGLSSAEGDLIGDSGDILFTTDGGDISGSSGELLLSGSSAELSFSLLLVCRSECGNGDERRRGASTLLLHLTTDGELNTSGGTLSRNGDLKECTCAGLLSGTVGISGLLNEAGQEFGVSAEDSRLCLRTASFTILLQPNHIHKNYYELKIKDFLVFHKNVQLMSLLFSML